MGVDIDTGSLGRRRLLRIGGLSLVATAVLAACGDDDEEAAPATTTTTALSAGARHDVTFLRTATSLELLIADVYDRAGKAGVVTTPAVGDAVKLFQAQHQEHAKLLQALTERLGGEAFSAPNPVLAQGLQPRLAALGSEAAVVTLALELERSAAATYQAAVGSFSERDLNQAAMSVGGVAARHVVVLAGVPPAGAFQTTQGAVVPGTGV